MMYYYAVIMKNMGCGFLHYVLFKL